MTKTRTTRTRRLLAAATLAALPLAVGALQVEPARAADPARGESVAERPGGPRWLYLTGQPFELDSGLCPLGGGWGAAVCIARTL